MKICFSVLFSMLFVIVPAFCFGNLPLVNTQEIVLDNITDVKIIYSSEQVSLFMGTTDRLIIKEYMSEDNSIYFAKIARSGNTVTIEHGRWPFRPFFNSFNRRLEVYLPLSFSNTISLRTSSGKIESSDNLFSSNLDLVCSSGSIKLNTVTSGTVKIKTSSGDITIASVNSDISVESSSGRINIDQITGVITAASSSGRIHCEKIQGSANLNTNSGNILLGRIEGDVSVKASSGRIDLEYVTGSVNAETNSGNIGLTAGEPSGDISLSTSSGRISLYVPQSLNFDFSSRTSSGRLTAPFSNQLSNPINDRSLTQGKIRGNNASENTNAINIRTNSGAIKIDWIQ